MVVRKNPAERSDISLFLGTVNMPARLGAPLVPTERDVDDSIDRFDVFGVEIAGRRCNDRNGSVAPIASPFEIPAGERQRHMMSRLFSRR
ncbi:hypothetical protein HSEST_1515 [Halapricum desulfuricans]|uniref:Uncharacterized protein n=1 Tax=Halapricum desulfuricans TaxID=2841257 RepID=A0A897NRJ2_9EURY|nr:hypothetical protein HSEST_1515 [Halapricum desulfuricans]